MSDFAPVNINYVLNDIYFEQFSNNNIKWENKDAISQLSIMIKKYGDPSVKDYSKGGIAIWDKSKLQDTCYDRIELLDESISHCVPAPHHDFLYHFVKYDIPDNKVLDVISLSGSVSYDPLKKYLRARCGSEEANIATLYLAVAIGENKTTLKDVQGKKLYKETIMSTRNSQNVEIYRNKLCEYLKIQSGDSNWTGYFPLAFPEGCCEGYNPLKNTCGNKEKFGIGHDHDHHTESAEESDKSDKSKKSKKKRTLKPVLFE
jgi:hypothetical protein